jgi:modulator of FtsH protease
VASSNEWREFFLTVGSAGAALTGLVFVAISLHPREIAGSPVLRARVSGAMSGFVASLFVGLVALLPGGVQHVADGALGLSGLVYLAIGLRLPLAHRP